MTRPTDRAEQSFIDAVVYEETHRPPHYPMRVPLSEVVPVELDVNWDKIDRDFDA